MTDCGETASANRVMLIVKQPGNVRVLEKAVAEISLVGIGVSSEADLERELAREQPPCSALVDVTGFGRAVWRLCEMLHRHDVPFVVLSPPHSDAISSRTLSYGAVSVLNKPVAKAALLQLVRNLQHR